MRCEAVDLLVDGTHAFLKHDLLGGRRTHDLRQVALVRGVPVRAPDVVQAESQQERLQPELGILERDPRGVAGPTEIANRFILDRRHVHGGQIPGPQ